MGQIEVQGALPGLNEYLAAYGRSRYIAGKLKREATDLVAWQVKGIVAIDRPAHYTFTWHVRNKRKDPDTIASAVKYIFDGLVIAGKLPDDTMQWVLSISHKFIIDSNERVVIEYETDRQETS
jgi:hypothetical protein